MRRSIFVLPLTAAAGRQITDDERGHQRVAKENILVLFGGVSTEHEVSCMSAASVIENIDREKFEVLSVGIAKDGRWLLYSGSIEDMRACRWEEDAANVPAFLVPDRSVGGIIVLGEEGSSAVSYTHLDVYKRQVSVFPHSKMARQPGGNEAYRIWI